MGVQGAIAPARLGGLCYIPLKSPKNGVNTSTITLKT